MKLFFLAATASIVLLAAISMTKDATFGEQHNVNLTSNRCTLQSADTHMSKKCQIYDNYFNNDTRRPSVNITFPSYPPTLTTGKIIIRGTASDADSGIHNISAAAHQFPFRGNFPILLASQPLPIYGNNWSKWSVPFLINATGTYRVVIQAIDNAGNVNYAETTINAPIDAPGVTKNHTTPKIAFVRPIFTEAAYKHRGFYDFYFKYGLQPLEKNITSDLNMLTVKTGPSTPELISLYKLTSIDALIPAGDEYRFFWLPFIDHVKKVSPNATVTVMRDEDVHDGHIFYGNYKTNVYDVLLLFHNEYVTQQEYDNLRQFVKNGGTIVFIDPNMLYAEVRYDRDNHTITLVKGHNWEYDGKAARRSVAERWYNETKDWVGGNYLLNYIGSNTTFVNNPFNYTHYEEQFVNNPKDKIIIDYGVQFPKDFELVQSQKKELPMDKKLEDVMVASYSLMYGKGKVLMLGIRGEDLVKNKQFMEFFDNVIMTESLCPKFKSCNIS